MNDKLTDSKTDHNIAKGNLQLALDEQRNVALEIDQEYIRFHDRLAKLQKREAELKIEVESLGGKLRDASEVWSNEYCGVDRVDFPAEAYIDGEYVGIVNGFNTDGPVPPEPIKPQWWARVWNRICQIINTTIVAVVIVIDVAIFGRKN